MEEIENYPSDKNHIDELQTQRFKILYFIKSFKIVYARFRLYFIIDGQPASISITWLSGSGFPGEMGLALHYREFHWAPNSGISALLQQARFTVWQRQHLNLKKVIPD
ncbi:MAG: hypothetical protein C0611_06395 [Desulfobacteraceae bacterium]|nr:hypothetical protein [Desulfobacteraceae bacterium]PLX53207.1 MAG: hypothetical protein C0611_06395 [Desulfobacteraceae bacterium]